MLAPAPAITFWGLPSESNRIIKCHSSHFRILAALFLFPLSLSLLLYPTFRSLTNSLPLSFLFLFFIYTISLSAITTITISAYRASINKPISLFYSISSLARSFLPLFLTTLASVIVLTLICLVFLLFGGIVHKFVKTVGIEIDYSSDYFNGSILFLGIVCGLVLVYCLANWTLAGVIVVVESKWGFEALWRSAYLLRGTKLVAVSKLVYFGVMVGLTLWVNSLAVAVAVEWWRIVVVSMFLSFFMLQNVVTDTVLYVQSVDFKDEVLFENVKQVSPPDYLSFSLIINEP